MNIFLIFLIRAQGLPSPTVRSVIEDCSGEGGITYEDDNDWCMGWIPTTDKNCTAMKEFEYVSSRYFYSLIEKVLCLLARMAERI